MDTPVLSVHGAQKSFAGVQALCDVDLNVLPGEIHALLGENGAGKSTLIKILAGVFRPDAGTFEIAEKILPSGFGPSEVSAAGLRFVHQDFGLVDNLSVLENVAFLTGFSKNFGLIDYKTCAKETKKVLDALDLDVAPEALVGDLPHAEKAIVALARAMHGDAKVIVLDEVTAALPSPDAMRVHKAIRAASDSGIAFIYVSHRLEEVFDICDRLTVLRDGCSIVSMPISDVNMDNVIEWIAGKSVLVRGKTKPYKQEKPIKLIANGLSGPAIVDFNLTVKEGEIVGITGIIGSGYDTICEMLYGLSPIETGTISIDGKTIDNISPGRMREAGCEIVVGDRSRGSFPELSVRENLFADAIYRKGGRGRLAAERQCTRETLAMFNIGSGDVSEMPIQGLSGGNQQKVLFARTLMQNPGLFVLIDPTAGVDIGARSELHAELTKASESGTGIVLGSSDFEEIVAICDRVLVVRDGAIRIELQADDITWDRLFSEAHGGHGVSASSSNGTTEVKL